MPTKFVQCLSGLISALSFQSWEEKKDDYKEQKSRDFYFPEFNAEQAVLQVKIMELEVFYFTLQFWE